MLLSFTLAAPLPLSLPLLLLLLPFAILPSFDNDPVNNNTRNKTLATINVPISDFGRMDFECLPRGSSSSLLILLPLVLFCRVLLFLFDESDPLPLGGAACRVVRDRNIVFDCVFYIILLSA